MESTRIYLNEPLVRSLAASSDTRSASKFGHSTLRGVAGVERESTLFQLCESIPAAGQILRVCILFPGRVCTLFNTLRTMSFISRRSRSFGGCAFSSAPALREILRRVWGGKVQRSIYVLTNPITLAQVLK